MPRRLSKPAGLAKDHQPLLDMLWRFYVAANEPAMKRIAAVIAEDDNRKATANHETVRRVMAGLHLPEWQTVEVVFEALCRIGDVDPDDADDGDSDYFDRWNSPATHRDRLRRLHMLARHGTVEVLPRTRQAKARQEAANRARTANDPWGSAPPDTRSGEPPF
ncbi:hypothetical protein [Amycolatopsis sp. cg13]|uniref:hypothetical protein n=1 Tax=Amycolatopsis sp. cg13 TaxID=3238807 RepID=UPI003524CD8F